MTNILMQQSRRRWRWVKRDRRWESFGKIIAIGLGALSIVLTSACSSVIYQPVGILEVQYSRDREYPYVITYPVVETDLFDLRAMSPRKEKRIGQIFLKRITGSLKDGDFVACWVPGSPGHGEWPSVGTIVFSGEDVVDIDIGLVIDAQAGKSRVEKLDEINGRHQIVRRI
jgi:hypothetical protein